jgi:beta-lactamase regulating signal transducer with metallopeptidase domain
VQIDLAQLLADLTGSAAVIVVLVLVFKPFIGRLMDNLDRQAAGYIGYVEAQVKVATTLESLCQKLNDSEDAHSDRADAQDARQVEMQSSQAEIVGVLRGLQQQMQSHEGRTEKRYQQAQTQAAERHAEQIAVLKHLNGKT